MDGPGPIDLEIETTAFRNDQAALLEQVSQGQVLAIRKRGPGGFRQVAVIISPTLWDRLGRIKRAASGLSTMPDGNGGYLTRDQLARHLQVESERIGEEAYQLTTGEMRAIQGLLAELAGHHADEPLGQLAGEWAGRLGKRTAPTS
jgi:hypothetical protein